MASGGVAGDLARAGCLDAEELPPFEYILFGNMLKLYLVTKVLGPQRVEGPTRRCCLSPGHCARETMKLVMILLAGVVLADDISRLYNNFNSPGDTLGKVACAADLLSVSTNVANSWSYVALYFVHKSRGRWLALHASRGGDDSGARGTSPLRDPSLGCWGRLYLQLMAAYTVPLGLLVIGPGLLALISYFWVLLPLLGICFLFTERYLLPIVLRVASANSRRRGCCSCCCPRRRGLMENNGCADAEDEEGAVEPPLSPEEQSAIVCKLWKRREPPTTYEKEAQCFRTMGTPSRGQCLYFVASLWPPVVLSGCSIAMCRLFGSLAAGEAFWRASLNALSVTVSERNLSAWLLRELHAAETAWETTAGLARRIAVFL